MEMLGALQEYFSRNDKPDVSIRELHDALDERFHSRGGMKYLYKLFPGGPVAQGCELAGLPVPAGAKDKSFGSAQ
jgi:tRNA 2-thiouridine synthesizing protein E